MSKPVTIEEIVRTALRFSNNHSDEYPDFGLGAMCEEWLAANVKPDPIVEKPAQGFVPVTDFRKHSTLGPPDTTAVQRPDTTGWILHCYECKNPLDAGHCDHCGFVPSMQDTYLQAPK